MYAVAYVDGYKCNGCKTCSYFCPQHAIYPIPRYIPVPVRR